MNLEKKEVSFKPKSIPQSLSEVSDHISSNLSKLVNDLVVKEGVLSPDFVDTDLYAVEISLKYINATGKEMTAYARLLLEETMPHTSCSILMGKLDYL